MSLESSFIDPQSLEQLRSCCKDEAAFQQMQQILAEMISRGTQTEKYQTLAKAIARIRESLDLETLFTDTAKEVRGLLDCDRVGIFRFDPDSGYDDGEFVSEAVIPGYISVLSARVHDHCFGSQYAVHYEKGRIQAVADIYNAGLKDCHIQVLAQFQIRANLVIPLLVGSQLWGLLCIHHCRSPRDWSESDINFVTEVSHHLCVALQHADLLTQTRQQAEQLQHALEQLQHTQTHLIQSEKISSLGQLVAGVAHEINNPINFITGNLTHAGQYVQDLLSLLELYIEHYPQPHPAIRARADEIDLNFTIEDLPKLLKSMQVGAERIRKIVLSLRNFSRLDQAEMKSVDIHEGIESTLVILQHRLKAKVDFPGIDLIKTYGQLPQVECYPGQLNQVFMNLISNAIDALEEGIQHQKTGKVMQIHPVLKITTEMHGENWIAIRIADNGAGMNQVVQQQIFNPFFTTKVPGRGTGLGLSISYQIVVDKHKGKLECYSQVGEGTEFVVLIPLHQPQTPVNYGYQPSEFVTLKEGNPKV